MDLLEKFILPVQAVNWVEGSAEVLLEPGVLSSWRALRISKLKDAIHGKVKAFNIFAEKNKDASWDAFSGSNFENGAEVIVNFGGGFKRGIVSNAAENISEVYLVDVGITVRVVSSDIQLRHYVVEQENWEPTAWSVKQKTETKLRLLPASNVSPDDAFLSMCSLKPFCLSGEAIDVDPIVRRAALFGCESVLASHSKGVEKLFGSITKWMVTLVSKGIHNEAPTVCLFGLMAKQSNLFFADSDEENTLKKFLLMEGGSTTGENDDLVLCVCINGLLIRSGAVAYSKDRIWTKEDFFSPEICDIVLEGGYPERLLKSFWMPKVTKARVFSRGSDFLWDSLPPYNPFRPVESCSALQVALEKLYLSSLV
ncbi:unnamed protein product [Notodromas monacha]|uniref:Uncharacterized protein n=1 Tax=Notodromas monacha TaxID=399045 RepID=A0A7R9GJ27_9CRUS|nr:unnamed protein product [Notodromas monacha]CAG0924449.1 unnamed protein product [Notodromas monacha]